MEDTAQPQIVKVPFAKGFVVLNDIAAARLILSTEDDYVRGLSQFDMQSKKQVEVEDHEVTVDEFVQHQASQVISFSATDMLTLENVIKSVSARLESYPLLPSLVPEVVYLNMTTGREESGAAYCRGLNGIFLPINMVREGSMPLPYLFTHELWHIISRNLSKQTRDAVYACIGFRPFDAPFQYPAPLLPLKISNPDGPKFEHYIQFALDGSELQAIPMIFSRHSNYSKKIAESFFRYIQVVMLFVRQNEEGVWVHVQNPNTQPDTVDSLCMESVDSMPESFWSQIGRNTGYFYHPDETTADNFVIMIHKDTKEAVTPAIVEKLAAVFGASSW